MQFEFATFPLAIASSSFNILTCSTSSPRTTHPSHSSSISTMSSVQLYVYDLSNGMARMMSLPLTGKQIDGIWHTSIVVYGREIYYGQGISECRPGMSHHGRPLQVIDFGKTGEWLLSLGTPIRWDMTLTQPINRITSSLLLSLLSHKTWTKILSMNTSKQSKRIIQRIDIIY